MRFYCSAEDEGPPGLQQGDILAPIPFAGFSLTDAQVLSPDSSAFDIRDLSTGPPIEPGTPLIATAVSRPGIVLNQTCDLNAEGGQGKPVLLAAIWPCRERVPGFAEDSLRGIVGQISALANPGRTPNLFYLPEQQCPMLDLPRSVADLLTVASFPPSDLGGLRRLHRLRLTAPALQAFQERLAYCFGRFGVPNDLYFSESEWQFVLEQRASKQRKGAR